MFSKIISRFNFKSQLLEGYKSKIVNQSLKNKNNYLDVQKIKKQGQIYVREFGQPVEPAIPHFYAFKEPRMNNQFLQEAAQIQSLHGYAFQAILGNILDKQKINDKIQNDFQIEHIDSQTPIKNFLNYMEKEFQEINEIFLTEWINFKKQFLEELELNQEEFYNLGVHYQDRDQYFREAHEKFFDDNNEGDTFISNLFKIFVEQKIIRNACEKYYSKKSILKNEDFDRNQIQQYQLKGKTILDNLKLASELTLYLKDWYYQNQKKDKKGTFNYLNGDLEHFFVEERQDLRQFIQAQFKYISPVYERTEKQMMYLISKDLEKLVKDKNKDKSEKYVPFIGISGYPASGKSWFTRTLKNYLSQEFGLNALIIDQESYLHADHILNSKEKPDRQQMLSYDYQYDSIQLLFDILKIQNSGSGMFKSSQNDSKMYDKKDYDIVLIQGKNLLLKNAPWIQLQDEVFDKTYFIHAKEEVIAKRLKFKFENIMQMNFIDLSQQIWQHEIPNARFIQKNVDFKKHEIIHNNPRERNYYDEFSQVVKEVQKKNYPELSSKDHIKCLKNSLNEIDKNIQNHFKKEKQLH